MHPAVLLVTGLLAALVWLSFFRRSGRPAPVVALGAVAVIAALGLLLFLGSRVHWGAGMAGLLLALPVIRRLWRTVLAQGSRFSPAPGQASTVETSHIRMVVDHASGEMTGEVLQGRYAGRAIEELDLEALLAVRRECTRADPQGAKVVETYLDRHHPGWDGGESDSGATSDRARPEATGEMGAKEALEVLGLSSEATDDEIVEAHRRLMQKVHPDRGGSGFLAAQINRAKDVLLGS